MGYHYLAADEEAQAHAPRMARHRGKRAEALKDDVTYGRIEAYTFVLHLYLGHVLAGVGDCSYANLGFRVGRTVLHGVAQ